MENYYILPGLYSKHELNISNNTTKQRLIQIQEQYCISYKTRFYWEKKKKWRYIITATTVSSHNIYTATGHM